MPQSLYLSPVVISWSQRPKILFQNLDFIKRKEEGAGRSEKHVVLALKECGGYVVATRGFLNLLKMSFQSG